MKKLETRMRRKVYGLLAFLSLLVLGLMAGGLWRQVMDKDRALAWARRQQIRPVRLLPMRGKILDRYGSPLAVSVKAGSVFAHPGLVEDREVAARRLAPPLGMAREEILAKLEQDLSFVWLARQVAPERARAVRALGLAGIGVQKEGRRYYPNRELAGSLVGFAGVDSQGLEGLEYYYDAQIRGTRERLLLQRDARGRVLWKEVSEERDDSSGESLQLTLDLRLQYLTERALRKAVDRTDARSAMAVILDPRDGEVLCMASVPSFDPNRFGSFAAWRRRNRAVTDAFEPGSTLKAMLLAAALEEGVVDEESRFDCEGGRYFCGGHWIHDMAPHDELTVREILLRSSNIGATKIAEALTRQTLWRYLDAFGFGRKSQVDLPGESSGRLRPWRMWSKVDLAAHAFGQGVSVTTLQLAAAFGALANGGLRVEPFVVREIRDARGGLVRGREAEAAERVVSERTAARVLSVLEGVVEEGTGKQARLPGVRVAGKTGTAQKYDPETGGYAKDRLLVSFVGVLPVEAPTRVIAVVIDEPKGSATGGGLAAPVFREIASASLLCSPPSRDPRSRIQAREDEPGGIVEPAEPERAVRTGADRPRAIGPGPGPWEMPDVRDKPLRAALRAIEGLPLAVRLEGSGRVRRQDPAPGERVRPGQTLRLEAAGGPPGSRGRTVAWSGPCG